MLTTTGLRKTIAAAALLALGATVIDVPAAWADQAKEATEQLAATGTDRDAIPGPEPVLLAAHPQKGPHPEPGDLASAEKNPNTGRISMALGTDWVSDYYYRGILFQTGDNVQQYIEVRFRLLEDEGPLTSLTLAGGNWNDFRTEGDTGDPEWWFEANLYARLSALWWNVLTTSATFIYYDSPNDSFDPKSDVTLTVSLDDSKWLGLFALNPSLTLAFQTHGQFVASADDDGIFLALGLAPGYTFFKKSKLPVNLSVPVTFGFSLRDYYTLPNGDNETWGYFQGGPMLTASLNFIPKTFGQWALKAGVEFLNLGDNLKQINGQSDSFHTVGRVGLSMTY
jgi:hypothetical protein